jgi:hypothetical protein
VLLLARRRPGEVKHHRKTPASRKPHNYRDDYAQEVHVATRHRRRVMVVRGAVKIGEYHRSGTVREKPWCSSDNDDDDDDDDDKRDHNAVQTRCQGKVGRTASEWRGFSPAHSSGV